MRDRYTTFTKYFMQENEELELDEAISEILADIQELNDAVVEKELLHTQLKSESEWLQNRLSSDPHLIDLEESIQSEKDATQLKHPC